MREVAYGRSRLRLAASVLCGLLALTATSSARPFYYPPHLLAKWRSPIDIKVTVVPQPRNAGHDETSLVDLQKTVEAAYHAYRAISTARIPDMVVEPVDWQAVADIHTPEDLQIPGNSTSLSRRGQGLIKIVPAVELPLSPAGERLHGATSFVFDSGTDSLSKVLVLISDAVEPADLQGVVVHEMGHLLGLGDTQLGDNAADYPNDSLWGPRMNKTIRRQPLPSVFLHMHEHSWISSLYGNDTFKRVYGSLTGQLLGPNRQAVCGALVVAESIETPPEIANRRGEGVATVAGYGRSAIFSLALPAGRYRIRVEPLSSDEQTDFNRRFLEFDQKAVDSPCVPATQIVSARSREVRVIAGQAQNADVDVLFGTIGFSQ